MRGTKLVKISSILLIVTGLLNLFLGYTNLSGANALLSSIPLARVNMILYIIEGLLAVISGIFGVLYNNSKQHVKIVRINAWIILITSFTYFFFSYGYNWGIVLYELFTVILSIVYFWGARRNLEDARNKEHKLKGDQNG